MSVACRQRRIGSAAKRRNRLAVVSSVSESVPVTRPALDPNWRMTILFLLCLAVLALLMKLIVLRGPDRSKAHNRAFVLSPILTPESFKRSRPLSTIPGLCLRTLLVWGALWLYYWIYGILVRTFDIPRFYLGYLAAPVVLLMGEGGFGVISLLWLPSGRLLPPLHRQPLLARGVADFWGRRWNLWFSDWFRHALFARMWRRPGVALFWVFFVSGLMHEWVLNLPLWLVTGRRCFGTMMLYFLLQAGGVLVEHQSVRGGLNTRSPGRESGLTSPASPVEGGPEMPAVICSNNSTGALLSRALLKRLLVWLVVLGPAPLLINEGLLRALHLWPK